MTGLKLVQEAERFVYEGDGFKIFYRRVPATIRDGFIRSNTPRRGGDPDWSSIGKLMLNYAIIGWEGVYEESADGQRVDVPFSADKTPFLPENVRVELVERLGEDAAKLEREIKNSSTT
jgi:hypothetical protein